MYISYDDDGPMHVFRDKEEVRLYCEHSGEREESFIRCDYDDEIIETLKSGRIPYRVYLNREGEPYREPRFIDIRKGFQEKYIVRKHFFEPDKLFANIFLYAKDSKDALEKAKAIDIKWDILEQEIKL